MEHVTQLYGATEQGGASGAQTAARALAGVLESLQDAPGVADSALAALAPAAAHHAIGALRAFPGTPGVQRVGFRALRWLLGASGYTCVEAVLDRGDQPQMPPPMAAALRSGDAELVRDAAGILRALLGLPWPMVGALAEKACKGGGTSVLLALIQAVSGDSRGAAAGVQQAQQPEWPFEELSEALRLLAEIDGRPELLALAVLGLVRGARAAQQPLSAGRADALLLHLSRLLLPRPGGKDAADEALRRSLAAAAASEGAAEMLDSAALAHTTDPQRFGSFPENLSRNCTWVRLLGAVGAAAAGAAIPRFIAAGCVEDAIRVLRSEDSAMAAGEEEAREALRVLVGVDEGRQRAEAAGWDV